MWTRFAESWLLLRVGFCWDLAWLLWERRLISDMCFCLQCLCCCIQVCMPWYCLCSAELALGRCLKLKPVTRTRIGFISAKTHLKLSHEDQLFLNFYIICYMSTPDTPSSQLGIVHVPARPCFSRGRGMIGQHCNSMRAILFAKSFVVNCAQNVVSENVCLVGSDWRNSTAVIFLWLISPWNLNRKLRSLSPLLTWNVIDHKPKHPGATT